MKQPVTHTSSEGFTLIEVIIAVAVLTIGVLAANVMQTAAIRGNSTAQRLTAATTWGGDMVERIFSLPYDAGSNGTDDDGDGQTDEADEDIFDSANSPYTLASFAANGADDDNDGTVDEADEGDPDGYQISWTVQDDTPIPNARQITVTVNYAKPGGQNSVTLNCVKISKM